MYSTAERQLLKSQLHLAGWRVLTRLYCRNSTIRTRLQPLWLGEYQKQYKPWPSWQSSVLFSSVRGISGQNNVREEPRVLSYEVREGKPQLRQSRWVHGYSWHLCYDQRLLGESPSLELHKSPWELAQDRAWTCLASRDREQATHVQLLRRFDIQQIPPLRNAK